MKLFVGLGNPGPAYHNTRHNVGFEVLETLARRAGSPGRRQRFQGEVAQATVRGTPVLLLWPLTWMNLSGSSVLATRDFYKIPDSDMIVVCDDFNLPLDTIRLRPAGSAGGQNGLADVLSRLGTPTIPRLRLGVGPLPAGWKTADYVLGKFSRQDRERVEVMVERAADAAEEWAALGIQAAMNKYN
ncbi:MAG: aminoacyl-tRNA hydrolase [Planctomycetota bacterium]|nr:MAG: aminoacyl-tRNA hydrolase [Planctomycetota bacterium]RLT16912.1 MAG: aminoacyl-tRNA hydrolase [Planctomycetota bacterium]